MSKKPWTMTPELERGEFDREKFDSYFDNPKHPASMDERIEATRVVEGMSFAEYEAEREAMVGVSPVVQAARNMEKAELNRVEFTERIRKAMKVAHDMGPGARIHIAALRMGKLVRGGATCFKPGDDVPRGTKEER